MVSYSRLIGKTRHWKRPSFLSRLPENYYRHRKELELPAERVHDVEEKGQLLDFHVADPKTLRIERKPDEPVNVVRPVEADHGIWAGEGVVKGFLKHRDVYGTYSAKFWFPNLVKTVIYSEILDKYLTFVMTNRALDKFDEAYGFDSYILQTPVQDLKSQLALDLRRKMLIALATKDFHKDNPEKQSYILAKYKEHIIPLEEAQWFGMELVKAVTKKKIMETAAPRPLKEKLTAELLRRLKEEKESQGEDGTKESFLATVFGKKG
ncbi:39S ribosomal protein L28, mitochondrial [Halotydeus destructor]|nr:39S ribosomal protein L28, mitochondrial [Halotydeus destructor]